MQIEVGIIFGLYWGYNGIMKHKIQTTILYSPKPETMNPVFCAYEVLESVSPSRLGRTVLRGHTPWPAQMGSGFSVYGLVLEIRVSFGDGMVPKIYHSFWVWYLILGV